MFTAVGAHGKQITCSELSCHICEVGVGDSSHLEHYPEHESTPVSFYKCLAPTMHPTWDVTVSSPELRVGRSMVGPSHPPPPSVFSPCRSSGLAGGEVLPAPSLGPVPMFMTVYFRASRKKKLEP